MLTKPRTVCFCQPVAATISASVTPLARFIMAITVAFLPRPLRTGPLRFGVFCALAEGLFGAGLRGFDALPCRADCGGAEAVGGVASQRLSGGTHQTRDGAGAARSTLQGELCRQVPGFQG